MKKRNLLKIFVSVIALFAFFGIMGNVNASYKPPYKAELTAKQPYYYASLTVPYGTEYNTSKFSLRITASDGTQLASNAPGICMLPNATSPPIGMTWRADVYPDGTSKPPEFYEIDNTEIVKYMYYGICPGGCTRDVAAEVFWNRYHKVIDEDNRVVLVHNAISLINSPDTWDDYINGAGQTDTHLFVDAVDKLPYPDGVFAYRVGNKVAQSLAIIWTDTYNLKITKTTSSNASGVSLKGAQYTIYSDDDCTKPAVKDKNGNLYDVLETNENGNTQEVTVFKKRKYWIKETRKPLVAGTQTPNENFELDGRCHLCDLENNDTCNVTSEDTYTTPEPSKGRLRLYKVDEDGLPLGTQTDYAAFVVYEGAKDATTGKCDTSNPVASLTLNNEEATRTTGFILTLGQPYCVSETDHPSGYQPIDDFDFTINENDSTYTKVFRIENVKETKGSVRVKKVDTEGNTIKGAKFGLYKNSDCSGNPFRTITTGNDGVASYSNLDLGDYCLKETYVPEGYILDDTPHTFSVTNEEKNVVLEDIENEIARGRLVIYKSISAYAGVKPTLIKNNSNYSFTGTVFNIYKDRCGTGDLVATTPPIQEGKNYVIVEDLEPGTYCVSEKVAPKGYYLTEATETVVLDPDGVVPVVLQDMPKLGTLKLIKYSNNESLLKSDTEKYSLQGAEFKITNEAGEDMGSLVVGPYVEGVGFETNTLEAVPFGTYYAKEVKGPDNGLYEMDENTYAVTISESNDPAKVNGVFHATNKFKKGEAYVNKVPAEEPDGSCTLAGAEYAVCKDEDCREVVVTLITKEDGKTQTEKLEPGVYYFQEQKAPDCFEVNSEVQRITVASGTTVEVTSKEQLIPKNPKTGIDNPYLITITTVAIGSAGLYFLRRKNAFRQI